jgi:hypothetical protein
MAVSPLVKQRALTISTKPTDGAGTAESPTSNASDDDAHGDLAEQMNARSRRKYVKGITIASHFQVISLTQF